MRKSVFIHTNAQQMVGAIVGRRSLKRNSANPDAFDVEIVTPETFPFFHEFQGRKFLHGGAWRAWDNADLQSFTPLRFSPPELMGHEGRAVVIDPDVFAVGDVNKLLDRDMEGKAILARPPSKSKRGYIASSVMLLDCAKLPHWNVRRQFENLFEGRLDYEEWMELQREPRETIGFLETFWNDFDRLASDTRLMHNTRRATQPWKTGLPIDFASRAHWLKRLVGISGQRKKGTYKPHPDPRQERYFFALLRECVEAGQVTEEMLRAEMAENHVLHDAPKLIEMAPPVDAVLAEARHAA